MAHLPAINIFKKRSTKPIPPIPDAVWQDPWYFIAFGLGSGTMPFAPGTFGTLLAIPFYLLIQPLPLIPYLVVVALFIIFSSLICQRVSKEMGVHDHPGITIDEFAGFFVTMIGAPFGWAWVLTGFVLFRIFDVIKPWPIRFFDENVKGGFGIVLDDVIAGLFGMIVIQIFARLL